MSGRRTGDNARVLSWPNMISLLRVPLAVAFVGASTQSARGLVLLAAAVTDWIDGWLARRLGQISRTGEVVDPLADKVFVVFAFASFAGSGELQPWELLVLIGRDLYVSFAFAVASLLDLPGRFRARWGGKVVTFLQASAVLVLLLRPSWTRALVLVTAAASLYAVVDYTRTGLDALRETRTARSLPPAGDRTITEDET